MTPSLDEAAQALERAGVESPRRNAEALLARAMGVDRSSILAGSVTPDEAQTLAFSNLCHRRLAREPLEYLLGQVDFCGLSLACDRRALIPRPETEDLVELAVRNLRKGPPSSRVLRIADLGTGSGAIALALKTRIPQAQVIGTDLSPDASSLALENARSLYLAVDFRPGPDLKPLDGRFDALVANPPYVTESEFQDLMPEVRDWEPRTALVGGSEGTEVLERWIGAAPASLAPGGWLAVEIGHTQAARVAGFFQSAGFSDITTTLDFAGIGRFVSGVRRIP